MSRRSKSGPIDKCRVSKRIDEIEVVELQVRELLDL
jgi:hypothetical protein